jgi:hypothetical protein
MTVSGRIRVKLKMVQCDQLRASDTERAIPIDFIT